MSTSGAATEHLPRLRSLEQFDSKSPTSYLTHHSLHMLQSTMHAYNTYRRSAIRSTLSSYANDVTVIERLHIAHPGYSSHIACSSNSTFDLLGMIAVQATYTARYLLCGLAMRLHKPRKSNRVQYVHVDRKANPPLHNNLRSNEPEKSQSVRIRKVHHLSRSQSKKRLNRVLFEIIREYIGDLQFLLRKRRQLRFRD